MQAGSCHVSCAPSVVRTPVPLAPPPPDPCTPAELRAFVHGGETDSPAVAGLGLTAPGDHSPNSGLHDVCFDRGR